MRSKSPRFPYEKSEWHCGESARWLEVLERYGAENARSVLNGAYRDVGSRASISIGSCMDITKGFAQEWLAWRDAEKAADEASFRSKQICATRWAAAAATVAATAAAIGWAWTIYGRH